VEAVPIEAIAIAIAINFAVDLTAIVDVHSNRRQANRACLMNATILGF
jgi:predicted nucleic acid-binding protein